MLSLHKFQTPTSFLSFNINFSMALFSIRNLYNWKINPKGTIGHKYVIIAIDYKTKWVEATSYAKITSKHVAEFIINNIICRYRLPHELISDEVSHFKKEVGSFLESIRVNITNLLHTHNRQMELSR